MLLPTILNFSERGPTDTTYFNVSTLSTRRDNNIEINQLENGDCYKYLGQDEDIRFNGTPNKERVTKKYFQRKKKIWSSELYASNKLTSHNIFAIPVITPTFGIINWTKEELHNIDIKTRKLLTSTGSFHINSDIDRRYNYHN